MVNVPILLLVLGGAFVLVLIAFVVAFVFYWGKRNDDGA
jgi:high-affinity Fe2+/Pb2+ permease